MSDELTDRADALSVPKKRGRAVPPKLPTADEARELDLAYALKGELTEALADQDGDRAALAILAWANADEGMPGAWVLNDDHTIRPARLGEFFLQFGDFTDTRRQVAATTIGATRISTVFIGYSFEDPPRPFETKTWGMVELEIRSGSWQEAELMHLAVVMAIEDRLLAVRARSIRRPMGKKIARLARALHP